VESDNVDLSTLATRQQRAVADAVEAVVHRDVDAVRALLPEKWQGNASDFWTWADDYGDDGPVELVTPPGDVDGWDANVMPGDAGIFVDVEMWATIGRTDLTLELYLYGSDDNDVRVEIRDMHVM
jgi:hypothetical protein